MTTLIISPDIPWSLSAQQAFIGQGLQCEVAHNGKDAQLKAYQKKYNFFVLDLEVQNHAALEVCMYLRKNCPSSKVFLTISSAKRLDELLLDEKKLTKMGIAKLFFQPAPDVILKGVQEFTRLPSWQNVQAPSHPPQESQDEIIKDIEFARVNIGDLFEDSVAIFDYYLRLGSNRFIKIIHKGEKPSREQLEKYSVNGTSFLYFKQKERATFISYQNDLAKESLKKSPQEGGKVITAMKGTTDKYFEEIFTAGIQPALIEEGKAICQNMYDAAIQDKSIKSFINDLEKFNPAAMSHAFLVSFFSALICKDLEWAGAKTIQTLALGALFHDIGMMQLPPDMQSMDYSLMNPEQKKLYETHPTLGAQALQAIPGLNLGVTQIVLQHHELMNGSGYPAGISAHKIYPLAKVVGLADAFAYFLVENEMSPIEGLKLFLKNPNNLVMYDPDLMKNLIKALK